MDWPKTISNWAPTPSAILISDANRVSEIVAFCQYIGTCPDTKIIPFSAKIMENLERDEISKNGVFELSADQIIKDGYKKVWRVYQRKVGKSTTYEFPLISSKGTRMRYMKFQILDGDGELKDPHSVKKVYLDYHISENPKCEVIYV